MNSNTDDSYLDLVLGMFNQYLFQECKNHIQDLILYYQTNPATMGNGLIENLLGSIKDYPLESIDLPLFNSILAKTGKTPDESKIIIDKIIQYKKFTKDQIAPARKYVKDIIATVYLRKATRQFRDSPSDLLTYLKGVEFKSTDTDYLNSTSFSNIDLNSVIAESNSSVLTSSMGFINESFSEGAFKPGDIYVVSMPPSVGKSLLAEADALHVAIYHKVPVHLLVMGDLSIDSLMIRLAAIYSGMTFKDARENLTKIYPLMCKDIGSNLDITIAPSGVIKADDYVQYILGKKKYKWVIADYDENFSLQTKDNMYSEFGDLYNEFTKLKDAGIISEILCQPKQFTWSDGNPIQLENLGTSSRKGHIADVVVTRTKEPNNLNGLGIFYIAKNRHGRNSLEYSIRLGNGRFKIIPKALYQDLKRIEEPRNFTESDIDLMIAQYEQQYQRISNDVNRKIEEKQKQQGPTPFGN